MFTPPTELTDFLAVTIHVFGWMVYPAAALMLLLFLVCAVWIASLAMIARRL
jgi:hypothetical protein